MTSSGLKMGLNLVKASVHTCQVRGREGEDLLSPGHPRQASDMSPLLLSPALPARRGRLSPVSLLTLRVLAPSPDPHPTPGCSRGFEATAPHLQTDGTPILVLPFPWTVPSARQHHPGGLYGEGPYSVF